MIYKTNNHLSFLKDYLKSYVYIYDGQKEVGLFCWNYKKKKWQFENAEGKSKFYRGEMK